MEKYLESPIFYMGNKYNEPYELDEYFKNKIKLYGLREKSERDRIVYESYKENYNKLRADYNSIPYNKRESKDLFLLACYNINHLIRFNKYSQFNASNGNDSYNEKNYNKIINFHNKFKNVKIDNCNTLEYDFSKITENDFIYCDIPYLNTNAVYNEKRAFGGWDIQCDYKMFHILEELNKRNIKWGLSNVFENRGKTNNHLIEWCNKNNWDVYHLNRNYNPFNRGNSNNDEVYITNYNL